MCRRWPLLLTTLVMPIVMACGGGGSVTTPVPASSGPAGIVFDDPQGRLSAHEATIRRLIEETLAQASAQIAVSGVSIEVSADASRAIPGYGIGGFAPNGFKTEIAIDSGFPDLASVLPERLPFTVAHELHHNARWRGPGYGSTLLESMVSEGLADHFAVELLGSDLPPWSRALTEAQIPGLMDRARPLLDSTSFDFGAWFFGVGGGLPRWTGYTLGYRLVETYQENNPGQSAADLVNSPAGIFRPR